MKWAVSIPLLFTYLQTSLTLLVHFSNNTNITLPSLYSTLGSTPTTNSSFLNISIVSSNDINGNQCTTHTNISQTFVIYAQRTIPRLSGCCTDTVFGSASALARTLHNHGASGLLLEATEQYKGGQVLGFKDDLDIPVVVVSSEVMAVLSKNHLSIHRVELIAISEKEKHTREYLITTYHQVVLAYTIIYGILILAMVMTLCIDFIRLWKSKDERLHVVLLKIVSLAAATCTYLWLTVDPFGFEGIMWWKACILYFLQQGLYTVVCLLVLLLLLYSPKPNPLVKNPERLAITVYVMIFIVMVMSLIQGFECHGGTVAFVAAGIYLFVILCISIGFFIFAKAVVISFMRSNNKATYAMTLPVKVTAFSLSYIIVQYIVIFLAFARPLGMILSILVATILGPFMFFVMFFMLFFPSKFMFSCLGFSRIRRLVDITLESSSSQSSVR